MVIKNKKPHLGGFFVYYDIIGSVFAIIKFSSKLGMFKQTINLDYFLEKELNFILKNKTTRNKQTIKNLLTWFDKYDYSKWIDDKNFSIKVIEQNYYHDPVLDILVSYYSVIKLYSNKSDYCLLIRYSNYNVNIDICFTQKNNIKYSLAFNIVDNNIISFCDDLDINSCVVECNIDKEDELNEFLNEHSDSIYFKELYQRFKTIYFND